MDIQIKESITSGRFRLTRFLYRFPWLWVDLVVNRISLPPWILSVGIFFLLLILGSIISLLAGEPVEFLFDIRRVIIFSLPAFASYTITCANHTLGKLKNNLKPWIFNSEEQTEAFWDSTPLLLMRGFWIFAIIWLAIIPSLYLFLQHSLGQGAPPPSDGAPPTHPKTIANVAVIMAPIISYFMGGATSIATMGLGTVADHMSRELDLKEGFVLKGAKGVLQPFNQLFWVTWTTIALPFLLIGMVAVTMGNISEESIPLSPMDIIPVGIVIIILISTVIVPQFFINIFLRKEKKEAKDDISQQIENAISIPEGASQEEILKHMHNLQALVYLEKKIENFNPTLVDGKFILQVIGIISSLVSTFLVIRTFLNLFNS